MLIIVKNFFLISYMFVVMLLLYGHLAIGYVIFLFAFAFLVCVTGVCASYALQLMQYCSAHPHCRSSVHGDFKDMRVKSGYTRFSLVLSFWEAQCI